MGYYFNGLNVEISDFTLCMLLHFVLCRQKQFGEIRIVFLHLANNLVFNTCCFIEKCKKISHKILLFFILYEFK